MKKKILNNNWPDNLACQNHKSVSVVSHHKTNGNIYVFDEKLTLVQTTKSYIIATTHTQTHVCRNYIDIVSDNYEQIIFISNHNN